MRFQLFFLLLLATAGSYLANGCGPKSVSRKVAFVEAKASTPDAATAAPAAAGMQPVSDRKSNHTGTVLILEYHKIARQEARWDRSIARFRGDLERLYKMGFRPVTLSSYVHDKMVLPPGASPVVITFDDSTPSQLTLLPNGSVDPDCAVGIWQAFAETHKDFPVHATFFPLPDAMWGQRKLLDQKFALLKSLGCEIGSHTVTHTKLSKLTDEGVRKEFGGAIDYLTSQGVPEPMALALPYGISPKNKDLIRSFDWKGKKYSMYAALLVGANPAPSPESKDFNPYRIPRVQGIEGLDGITYWLDEIEKGKVKVYVE